MSETREEALERIVRELHWMARRYADGRSTYATARFNDCTRHLLALGVDLQPGREGLWARDGMGRRHDGLTEAEAASVTDAPPALDDAVREWLDADEAVDREAERVEQNPGGPWMEQRLGRAEGDGEAGHDRRRRGGG